MPIYDAYNKPIYNCPNCAAPIGYTEKCPYCGTFVNWIPTTEVLFVPMQFRRKTLEAGANVEAERLISGEVTEANVMVELAKELAVQLPRVWELRKKEDPIRNMVHYMAKVYIGERMK